MRRTITGVIAALAIGLLAACSSAPQVASNVPSNVAAIQQTTIGKALNAYGYVPVYVLGSGAFVYVANCPKPNGSIDLGTCSSNIYNEGSLNRPNVYVQGNTIIALQGPHDGGTDNRSYWSTVPTALQNFGNLTTAQQLQVLTKIMPAVKAAIGEPDGSGLRSIYVTNVGQLQAMVSRIMPDLQQ